MKNRCFSKCRGLKEPECVKPCSFVKEKYCRLSSTLKMTPPDCRIMKRAKSSKRASKKAPVKHTNILCSDSNVCFFGKDFKDFTHAVSMKKTQEGWVIYYKKGDFLSHALLKSNQNNLAYEYLVGQFLNEMSKKSPLFLETYGLYVYPKEPTLSSLAHTLVPLGPEKLAMICGHPEMVCLLVQHIQGSFPLTQMVRNAHFFIHDALYVFYQIYFTLSMLRKVFTHGHLECKQVMLYEPVKNGYIEYHYHLPKEVVRFKSSYLVKVKEVGNSYFKGSKPYYDLLCKEPRCECGKGHGFQLDLNGSINESHDLGLLKDYQELSRMKSHPNKYIQSFVQVFEDVHSNKIHQVSEAEKRLRVLIQDPVRQRINTLSYTKSDKLGDLHVYTNGKEVDFVSQKNI